jgi:probable F420-dependent oxidoreductase
MATTTARVQLASSVALAFVRSPMVVAYLARNLQELSGDRFVLGLGTQVKGHIERRFSGAWDSPGPRLREYVQALRAIWACWENDQPLDFRGQFYQLTLMTPDFNPGPSAYGSIRVEIAAVNPYNLQLAGELCDGLRVHPFSTPEYIRAVIWPNLARGAARAGRSLDQFQVVGGCFIATGPDAEQVRAARETVRRRVAFYGSTRAYRPVLAHHGWGELSTRLSRLVAVGRWEELPDQIPDEVLDRFCVAAPYEALAERVAERLGGLVDWVQLTCDELNGNDAARLSTALEQVKAVPAANRSALLSS